MTDPEALEPLDEWQETPLPAEFADSVQHAFEHLRDAFDGFAASLLNCVTAMHHLARLIDETLIDGEEPGEDQ